MRGDAKQYGSFRIREFKLCPEAALMSEDCRLASYRGDIEEKKACFPASAEVTPTMSAMPTGAMEVCPA